MKRIFFLFLFLLTSFIVGYHARSVYIWYKTLAQATTEAMVVHVVTSTPRLTPVQYATASWYDYSLEGASSYSKEHDTCASRDYPKGSMLEVKSVNGNKVVCKVNDYGPEVWTDRQLDLSSHAFEQLAPLDLGLITVTIQEVK